MPLQNQQALHPGQLGGKLFCLFEAGMSLVDPSCALVVTVDA
jgi:hypothetical protein